MKIVSSFIEFGLIVSFNEFKFKDKAKLFMILIFITNIRNLTK